MKKNYFVGRYVNVVREVAIAGILAQMHVCFVGPPGCGKTAMLIDLAGQMAGQVGRDWVLTRIDPSTSAEAVLGMPDPAAVLDVDNPRFERILDGTPFQPGVKMWLPDEVYRGSDPFFDAMMQPLDMGKTRNNGDYPVALGTTNFIVEGPRVEALNDRFSMIVFLKPGPMDVDEVVRVNMFSGGRPEMPGQIPDWDEVEDIRAMVPTEKSYKAVRQVCRDLYAAASKEGRAPERRRMNQWQEILFRYSAYLLDTHDFDTVPDKARRMLRYCYAATSEDEASAWANIVSSVMDVVGAGIDRIMAKAVEQFREVSQISDQGERMTAVARLGKALEGHTKSLQALSADDSRIHDKETGATQQLTNWFAAAAQGQSETIVYEGGDDYE
jgi:MoxR-like ATPase